VTVTDHELFPTTYSHFPAFTKIWLSGSIFGGIH